MGTYMAYQVEYSKPGKVADINAYGTRTTRPAHRTTITERELNAYFAFDVQPDLPAGVVMPAVTIVGDGRLSGRAVVDLDAVRRALKAVQTDKVISGLGLDTRWPEAFEVRASCADAAVSILGVPFEFWSLALFAVAGLVLLTGAIARSRRA